MFRWKVSLQKLLSVVKLYCCTLPILERHNKSIMEACNALFSVVFFALVSMATAVNRCIEFLHTNAKSRAITQIATCHFAHSQSGVWHLAEILTMPYAFVYVTALHIPLWLPSFSRQAIDDSFKHLEERSFLCCTHSNFVSKPLSRHFKTGLHTRGPYKHAFTVRLGERTKKSPTKNEWLSALTRKHK